MTFHWKIPAVAAGGAFLLSLLVGIIGGVTFGTILLRAFIWALTFGALAFGADMLFRRYIPEFYSGETATREGEERTVDITLDEENPVEARRSADEEDEDYPEASDDSDFDSTDSDIGDEEEVGTPEAEPIDETVASSPTVDDTMEDSESDDIPEGDLADFSSQRDEDAGTGDSDDARSDAGGSGDGVVPNVDVLGLEEDPETIARAVRSFMNRDQEG